MHEMTHGPIKVSGQLFAVAASLLFATSAFGNTARFYDDGLRMYDAPQETSALKYLHMADTSRFYDDGLTRPVLMPSVLGQQQIGIRFETGRNDLLETDFPFQIWPNLLE